MSFRWDILSHYKSELMGISIFWIVIFHLVGQKFLKLPLPLTNLSGIVQHGNIGVDIFLLLSGMGLYYSCKKNFVPKLFYKKRIKRILIPYMFISVGYWALRYIFVEPNIGHFIADISLYSFWACGRQIFWFIALLIPLYIIYPLIFIITESKYALLKLGGMVLTVYVGLWILQESDFEAYKKIEIALTRIPDFIMGSLIGKWAYDKKPLQSGMKLLLFSLSIFALGAFDQKEFDSVNWHAFRVFYFFFGISIAVWIGIILECISCKKINQMFRWGGEISLELYLVHMTMIYTGSIKTMQFGYVLVGVGSLLISAILHYYVFPAIYRKIERI